MPILHAFLFFSLFVKYTKKGIKKRNAKKKKPMTQYCNDVFLQMQYVRGPVPTTRREFQYAHFVCTDCKLDVYCKRKLSVVFAHGPWEHWTPASEEERQPCSDLKSSPFSHPKICSHDGVSKKPIDPCRIAEIVDAEAAMRATQAEKEGAVVKKAKTLTDTSLIYEVAELDCSLCNMHCFRQTPVRWGWFEVWEPLKKL